MFLSIQQKFILDTLKKLNCVRRRQLHTLVRGRFQQDGFEITQGYIRPDHGRHLWGEGPGTVRPGYGLYDRALGVMYMLGVWDTLESEA